MGIGSGLALRTAAWAGVGVVGLGGLTGLAEAGGSRDAANRPAAQQSARPDRPRDDRQRPARMMAGVLHGEFTVRTRDGAFQQRWLHRGEVTEVTPASITIKSEDDYTKTYVVTPQTEVRKGREEAAITDVKVGDRVGAAGEIVGGVYTTRMIVIRPADPPQRRRPDAGGSTAPSSSGRGAALDDDFGFLGS